MDYRRKPTVLAASMPRVSNHTLMIGLLLLILMSAILGAALLLLNVQGSSASAVPQSSDGIMLVQNADGDETEAVVSVLPSQLERISWGAIIAGTMMALVVQMLLNLLGLAIGASTIDPVHHDTPDLKSLGMGAMAWMGISTLVSLFIGGWVSGRLSGMTEDTDAILHGLITWAFVTLLSTFFITTSLGSLLAGATSVVARALSATGKGIAALGTGTAAAAGAAASAAGTAATAAGSAAAGAARSATNAASDAADELDRRGVFQNMENEIRQMLQKAGIDVNAIQANAQNAVQYAQGTATAYAQDAANTARETAQGAVQNVASNPSPSNIQGQASEVRQQVGNVQEQLNSTLRRIFNMANKTVSPEDRRQVTDMLTSQLRMTQQEAEQTMRRWEMSVERARAEAEQTAREAAQKAAQTVAMLSGAVFTALVIGAFAAGLGGYLGSPDELPDADVETINQNTGM